ncbi:MAG: dihydrodipicolinate synthase family protein [Devosia sp.]
MAANDSLCPSERLRGVHAATVCPLDEGRRVDETALEAHLSRVMATKGIKGLLINGHAGEGAFLSLEEKAIVVEAARAAAGGRLVCAGVTSESTAAAVVEAESAARHGADALLVFPPNHFALGHDAEMALTHHRAVASVGLPLVLYRAPILAGRMAYSVDTLQRLAEIETVAGIKEGSWEVAAYEEVRRTLKALRPDVAVLASGDEHLLTGFLIGTEGSQVSLAAVAPDVVVALFEAAMGEDWSRARRLHDALYPLSVAIYRNPPAYRATPRLKACLAHQGAIPNAFVKPPNQEVGAAERATLADALRAVDAWHAAA